MTHNTIHDEEKMREFFEKFGANKIWVNPSKENVQTILDMWSFAREYAEHILSKAIDAEVERLRTLRTLEVDKMKTADDEKQESYFRGKVDFITDRIIEVESRKLKAQLTKSK